MPVYEYACLDCKKRISILLSLAERERGVACPQCGSRNLRPLVSRFRTARGEEQRLDELADRHEVSGEPDSAAGMRDWLREAGKAMDDDMADEFEEMFEGDQDE